MYKKTWFFKSNALWGILGVMLVFGMLATGCPTGNEAPPPATYTVTFDEDGGMPAPANQSVVEGGKVTRPATDPTKADHTFANWYKDAAKTILWNFDTDVVVAETTIYAKWVQGENIQRYTVTFDVDGGTPAPTDQSVLSGEKVTRPADPTKSGKTFDNWYKDADKTILWNFDVDTVGDGNTTIYAKWVEGPASRYTVTFNADGGTPVPAKQTVVKDGKITSPADPTKAEHTFGGWHKEAALTNLWNFGTDTVTEDITLYAKWTALPRYTVTFDVDGGTPAPANQSVVEGGKVIRPATDPTKTEYTFLGWHRADRVNPWNFDVDTVTANTTIYANWAEGDVDTYTVTFDADGGSAVPDQTVVKDEKVTQPAEPTKAEHTFDGWYREAALTNQWNFGTDTVTANITLYAKWTPLPKYTVTFDVDGGSAVTAQSVVQGGKVTKPANPAKENNTFANWYKDADKTIPWNFDTDTVTEATTIYAKWVEGDFPRYTVIFDADGGTPVPATQNVTEGETVAPPSSNPAKAEYTFTGWYKGDAVWNFSTDTVDANITLKARWTAIPKYTVTFDEDGGSAVPDQTVLKDGKVTQPTEPPTKAEHTFDGWHKDSAKETLWDFGTDTVTENITLYAKWTHLPYTVNFDVDGGSAVDSQSVVQGGKVMKPADPTKAEYTFDGWYKDSAKETSWDFDTDTVTADITLHAKWTPLPKYTVTFDVDGGSAVTAQSVVQGGKVTRPATDPTKENNTFANWYKDADKTTLWNFDTDTVTEATTIYAKWVAGTVSLYTVTFDANGGTPVPVPQKVTKGETVAPPANPAKAEYTFRGWYKGDDVWNFSTGTVDANIILKAQWTEIPKYTVTFDADGGTPVPAKQSVLQYETADEPAPAPAKDGYTFTGWYSGDSYNASLWNFGVNTVNRAITLKAHWEKIPQNAKTITLTGLDGYSGKYDVYLVSESGSADEEWTVTADASGVITNGSTGAAALHSYTGTNEIGAAWRGEGKFKVVIVIANGNKTFISNGDLFLNDASTTIAYTASAFTEQYTVTADSSNEGSVSVSPSPQAEAGTKITLTATPYTVNFVFVSYTSDDIEIPAGQGPVFTFTMPAKSVRVYARFTSLYTVTTTIPAGGGTVTASPSRAIAGTKITLKATAGSGHSFESYTSSDIEIPAGTGAEFTFTMPAKNVSIAAGFTAPVASITLTPDAPELSPGAVITLVPVILPADASNRTLEWASSDTKVATVSAEGVVTAVSDGTATITAKARDGSGKSGSAEVTVKAGDGVVVAFSGFGDETIDLTLKGNQALSKSRGDSLIVSLPGGGYDSILGIVDGNYGLSSDSGAYRLYASDYSLGPHTLSVIVKKDGVPYSKTLKFQVIR
jgi:uncharacterized repeat protein (TIGR02543 family)